MAHNLESVSDSALSALVIRGKTSGGRKSSAPVYARITKLGGFGGSKGLRIKVRRSYDDAGPGPVDIEGEDLYALREFLAELPEEAFVRPADPVEKPDRWTDGDIVEEHYGVGKAQSRIWRRRNGRWGSVDAIAALADFDIENGLGRDLGAPQWHVEVIRQASGQDL